MQIKINDELSDGDSAYDAKLKIDFRKAATAAKIEEIDMALSEELSAIGIGFASGQGDDFIEAAMLNFGDNPKFIDLKTAVANVLSGYSKIIKHINYYKFNIEPKKQIKPEFITWLETNYYTDFNDKDEDFYVLDDDGNIIKLYLDGAWKTTWYGDDPKYIRNLNIFIPICEHLEVLHIRNWMLKDMSAIKHFKNLKELNLGYNNYINKIRGLKNLTKLESLNLACTGISKIKGLDNLKNLKILDLHANNIQKIENINHLCELETLLLGDNHITKIKNISNLTKLKKLTIGSGIGELPNFKKFKQLQELGIQGNIRSLDKLQQLRKLDTLILQMSNKFKNFDFSTALNKVKNLKINTTILRGDVSQVFYSLYHVQD